MKSEIIKLRQKIYKNLKSKALGYEGGKSSELKKYQKDQSKFSMRPFFPSDIDELSKQVNESRIIYLGDFHTFDQNIRNVLRILKLIINKNNQCIIALEMVDSRYQFYIDTYLDGHLTDLEFLECINYHDSWRFPWSHYKLIFESAKKYNVKIVALNTKGTLKERDKFAAKLISHTLQNYPDHQILVLYGELHIAEDKIPRRVAKYNLVNTTIIHQNLDEVYWKQIEENQSYKIVKFSDSEFCINSAPPWIKYESMIYWYENLCDDPDFDIHEYIIENGKKTFSDDTHENFFHICQELIDAIKIDFIVSELEDFNLVDHTALENIEEKISEYNNSSLRSFYEHLIYTGQSFRLPDQKTFYCSSYSMNRISYLAGVHIYHYFLNANNLNAFDILKSKNPNHKFFHLALESLFGYFFSKVINPHRKCELYLDLRTAQAKATAGKKRAIDIAIQVLDESDYSMTFHNVRLSILNDSALLVGHILGEYLYENIFIRETKYHFEKDFLMATPDDLSFLRLKKLLLKGINYKKQQKRLF